MFDKPRNKTFVPLVLLALLATGAVAAPTVNMKNQRFVTAQEKNAVTPLRMRAGFQGEAVSRQTAEKIFRSVNRKDDVYLKDDGSNHLLYVAKDDPSAHFRVDKTTGDFTLSKGLRSYLNENSTTGLPDKQRAVTLATEHLAKLGLLPNNQKEMVVRHVGGMKQADVSRDGKMVERDKLVTVHFGRQINGIDVGGPGSKIVVELGRDGELVSVYRRWVEVAPSTRETPGAQALHSNEEVVQMIKAKLQQAGDKARSIDSSAPEFGYFDDGKGNIEPAYFFTAELTYELEDQRGQVRRHAERHNGAVPALRSSRADFEQLERAKAQPRNAEGAVKGGQLIKP